MVGRGAAAWVILLGVVGCQNPAHAAWLKACHANEQVPAGGDPSVRNVAIARWIEQNVHDPSVHDAFAKIAQVKDKRSTILAAAAKAGVTDCPVVEAMWGKP